jgi:predicted LPLAT superfamily acyltransferase
MRPGWTTAPERGTAGMLRLMTWLSLRLGRATTRLIVRGIAAYFLLTAPAARRASRLYLRRALGREPRMGDLYHHLLAFASTIHDRLYLLNDRFDLFEVTVHGQQLLIDAADSGQGAFLMGAHMGSFEVLRALARRQPGVEVAMVMYEDNARRINGLMAAINPKAQHEIIPLGHVDSMLEVRRRLDGGAFVGMLGDRTFGHDATRDVPFLGVPAPLPLGALRMAAVLRRPVLFILGLFMDGNRYAIHVERLADFSRVTRADRKTAIDAALERYAQLLERHCRAAPYNWFNFYDFWAPRGEDGAQRDA